MNQAFIKNHRKLFSPSGGDPSLPGRMTILENNEYKVAYFQSVSSASGTITKPTGSTILTDQLAGGVDAYVSTISNSQPTGEFPQTSGGDVVTVSSFDTTGAYTLSGTPSSFPVAIIYMLKISAANYSNLVTANILELEETVSVIITTTASSSTPTPVISTDIACTDILTVTAQAATATFAAPSGTAMNGKKLIIRIKDNGTARTLNWNAIYRGGGDIALPSTTVLSKTMYLGFVYNSADTKWDLIAYVDNI